MREHAGLSPWMHVRTIASQFPANVEAEGTKHSNHLPFPTSLLSNRSLLSSVARENATLDSARMKLCMLMQSGYGFASRQCIVSACYSHFLELLMHTPALLALTNSSLDCFGGPSGMQNLIPARTLCFDVMV